MNSLSLKLIGIVLLACCTGIFASQVSVAATTDARLVKILSGKNEAVRMKALATIENTPGKALDSLTSLCAAARSHCDETGVDEIVRPSTMELLYLVGSTRVPEAMTVLVEMLDAQSEGIAIVAADALGKNEFIASIDDLKRQIDRDEFESSYGFRFNLVRALARMQDAAAWEFLAELRDDLDGQLRFEIDKLLKEVNEADFRGDKDRLQAWQTKSSPQITLKPAGFESESRQRLKLVPTRNYYGIEIEAKRMMFIIDHSGSMSDTVAGYSRLDRAKIELIRTVKELPSDSEFAITFYSDDVRPWQSELLEATDINKQKAITAIQQLMPGGWTNTYGALRRSMLFDSQLEAVFLLTDGKPTCGDIVAPQAIINDIVHRNRFRHLKINTIGIAVDGSMQQFLKLLAESTAGEFRQAE